MVTLIYVRPMKVEHEVKLNPTKIIMIRLEPVSLMIKKSRLGWLGYVERKDDNGVLGQNHSIQNIGYVCCGQTLYDVGG